MAFAQAQAFTKPLPRAYLLEMQQSLKAAGFKFSRKRGNYATIAYCVFKKGPVREEFLHAFTHAKELRKLYG
jgi:hypothetical protein